MLHIVGTKALLRTLRRLPERELSILSALRPGRITPHAELIDLLWGDDPEGGPLDASRLMRQYVFRLRRKGIPVQKHYAVGYSIAAL